MTRGGHNKKSVIDDNGNKFCIRCENFLPLDQFNKNSKAKDGLYSYCRTCDSVRSIISRYNIEEQHYYKLVWEQGGKCKICGRLGKLVVDHNHTTNKVRSLLCTQCNTALGLVNENIDVLQNMIEYMKEHNGN